MMKDTVYSWRLPAELKSELEQAARRQQESVAGLLERITRRWLKETEGAGGEEEQRRLHAAVLPYLGTFDGGDPDRSTLARQTLRTRLARRHGRAG